MCQRVLCCLILSLFLIPFFVFPVQAQGGCVLQINEVMYHPGGGTSGTAVSEWVELYVAQNIGADTTFFITDQDGGVGNFYSKQFVIPAGTAAGTYIIVNNDGDPDNDGQTTMTGIYTTISFFIGNGSVELNNDGDEIVLYQGGMSMARLVIMWRMKEIILGFRPVLCGMKAVFSPMQVWGYPSR